MPSPDLDAARREAEEALAAVHVRLADRVAQDRRALRSLLAATAPNTVSAPSLDRLAREVHEWAQATFPGTTEHSKAEHLRREAEELAAAPTDPKEMADVFILLANLAGFVGVDLASAVAEKHAENKARKWGKPDAHGVVEHVRESATAPAPSSPPAPASEVRGLTHDDAMTVLGHAEYLSRVHGEEDMPRYFRDLSQRILAALDRGGKP